MILYYDTDAMQGLAAQLDGTVRRLDEAFAVLGAVTGDDLPQPVAGQLDALGSGGRFLVDSMADEATQSATVLRRVATVFEESDQALSLGFRTFGG